MVRPGLLGLCLVALCVACQPQPKVYHVERGRSYAEDRAVVWERIQRFLEANHITVVSADPATGVIEAERRDYQNTGWANCERARVTDRTSDSARPTRARPLSRDLALELTVRESAAGTEVQPRARFSEQQNDPYRNWPFTQPCRSTGVLESALLGALGAPRRRRRPPRRWAPRARPRTAPARRRPPAARTDKEKHVPSLASRQIASGQAKRA